MTNYRRNFLGGGTFFFTVNLADRRSCLLTTHIDLLRQAFRDVRRRHPFEIEAIVILPDHLHGVWTLPEGDADFALRWRQIKAGFSRALPGGESVSAPRRQGRARRVAAALLGAHDTRRKRFCAACRLHPFQSGQTWARHAGEGLAAFVVSSDGQVGDLSAGLGGRCGG